MKINIGRRIFNESMTNFSSSQIWYSFQFWFCPRTFHKYFKALRKKQREKFFSSDERRTCKILDFHDEIFAKFFSNEKRPDDRTSLKSFEYCEYRDFSNTNVELSKISIEISFWKHVKKTHDEQMNNDVDARLFIEMF